MTSSTTSLWIQARTSISLECEIEWTSAEIRSRLNDDVTESLGTSPRRVDVLVGLERPSKSRAHGSPAGFLAVTHSKRAPGPNERGRVRVFARNPATASFTGAIAARPRGRAPASSYSMSRRRNPTNPITMKQHATRTSVPSAHQFGLSAITVGTW